MQIRSAAKALVLHRGKLLLNQCHSAQTGDYYSLPGGGQHPGESMEDALVRECLEETGYQVRPLCFAALYEEIYTNEQIRAELPRYAHKILHIFRCELREEDPLPISQRDFRQRGCVWADAAKLPQLQILPLVVGKNITQLLETPVPLFLGSHRIDLPHTI